MAEDSTQPPHATRFVETTRGILSYAQLAPLLAERVLRVEEDIEDGSFATRALDGNLLLDLHRGICDDLTRSDLDDIWFYIAGDSPDAADKFARALVSRFPLLAEIDGFRLPAGESPPPVFAATAALAGVPPRLPPPR